MKTLRSCWIVPLYTRFQHNGFASLLITITKIEIAGIDMKVFLILFALALVFVIGSASMMRYLGNKSMPKKEKKDNDDV